VQYGAKKYASLKKEDDPYTITLERARQLILEKQEIEANRIIKEFPEAGIQVLNGRYGPYISDGKKNGKIPKDRDPKSLSIDECTALLAAAPERGANRWGRKTAAKTTPAAEPEKKPRTAASRSAAAGNGAAAAKTAARKAVRKKPAAKKKAPAKKTAGAKKKATNKKPGPSPLP